MKEKDFTTRFLKWLKYNNHFTAAYELKFVNLNYKKSLNYASDFPLHQRECLQMVGSTKFVYKIADEGLAPKPFDCFKIANSPGYLVVMFWKRGVKHFYMFEISDILQEIKDKKKSLNEERARHIGRINYLK